MSSLSIQKISTAKFATSRTADKHTLTLMEGLGLSTKANVARLAIGRSLNLGPLNEEDVDSGGLPIPATSLFKNEDVAIWVGLIVTHSKIHHPEETIRNMDGFRHAVRQHWHRGVRLLTDDWYSCDEDYDSFLETLISRRAELPEEAASPNVVDEDAPPDIPEDHSESLLKALGEIGVKAKVSDIRHGPRITRYKVYLKKIADFDKLKGKLEQLSILLNLGNVIPQVSHGDERKTVFLLMPRPDSTWTFFSFKNLKKWLDQSPANSNELNIYPGVDTLGEPFSIDLVDAPHLLIAGATGQGKSVCLHSIILSLVLSHSADTLKLALVDPKQVEFSPYKGSKYLYNSEVASGLEAARECIDSLVEEMESRYSQFEVLGVDQFKDANDKGANLPFIIAIIDEMGDLILQEKQIEENLIRLAQKARAAGIHLVLATQRPEANTFSGLLRSNIPSRIALYVQKGSESKIILDEQGAENLLGKGDMLLKMPGKQTTRLHGVYVTKDDIKDVLQSK